MTKGKELTIFINLKFDKNDMVLIAVAKAEKKLRDMIALENNNKKDAEERVADLQGKLQVDAEKNIPSKISQLVRDVKVLANKLGKMPSVGISHTFKDVWDKDEQQYDNRYVINVKFPHGDNPGFKVEYTTPQTTAQRNIRDQITVTRKAYELAVSEALKWKEKLADIDTFERQIKAHVVERQLQQTEEGKKLLNAMDTNFEGTLEMIGF